MTGKLLQAIGVLTILGLIGAAIAGFVILKDRVRVVVQSDETELGPDPTALLRDDVQVLSASVDALGQAIAQNFEQLAGGLEQGAERRHDDVRQLSQQVSPLSDRLRRLEDSVQQLQQALANGRPQPEPIAANPTGGESSSPSERLPATTEPDNANPAVNREPAPKQAAQPGTGFLSFTLPSTKLAFDQLQDYTLLPRLCRVGFDAKSTLHDFTGVTSDVSGAFTADFDDPAGAWQGAVVATAAELRTGVDGRDKNMREHLSVDAHPQIRFAIDRFEPAANGVDVARKKVRGNITGKMTIRGATRPLTMPIEVEVDPQQRVVIKGQTKLLLSDYDVPVPNQLGVIGMEDEVVIWIALRARAQKGKGSR